MLNTTSILVRGLLILTLVAPALAQDAPPAMPAEASPADPLATPGTPSRPLPDKAWRLNIYLENDSSWLKPNAETDRWYTNGTVIEATHQPDWARNVLDIMPFADQFGPYSCAAGYRFGQLMFTPRNIDLKTPQPDDRPFAGHLFAGVFLQRSNDTTLDHFQLDVGMLGPSSLAEDVQKFTHKNFPGGDNPRGWDNQMRDEPTVQATIRKKWKLDLGDVAFGNDTDSPTLNFELIPEAAIALGTVHRHLEAAATFRAGFALPDDFGPAMLANPGDATSPGLPDGWTGYAFLTLGGKAVEHNLYLDGSDFRSNRVDVNHEPLVGQATAGINIGYRSGTSTFSLTYSQTYMTHEFRGQSGTPAWGSLTMSFAREF